MQNYRPQSADLLRDGFAIVDAAIPESAVLNLCAALQADQGELATVRGGARNLFALPAVRELVAQPAIRKAVAAALGPQAFGVRALYFDKTPETNWKVAWHQDLSIAVRAKCEAAGFGPWSLKAGVNHVQPPADILEQMVAIRIHLDECGPSNGPVRVLPASHLAGKLSAESISACRQRTQEITCTVGCGGLLVMRPLLLHASSQATVPSRRRVLHLEFAAIELPQPLQWDERLPVPSGGNLQGIGA